MAATLRLARRNGQIPTGAARALVSGAATEARAPAAFDLPKTRQGKDAIMTRIARITAAAALLAAAAAGMAAAQDGPPSGGPMVMMGSAAAASTSSPSTPTATARSAAPSSSPAPPSGSPRPTPTATARSTRAEIVAAMPGPRGGLLDLFAPDPAEAFADRVLAMMGATEAGQVTIADFAGQRVNFLLAFADTDRDAAISQAEADAMRDAPPRRRDAPRPPSRMGTAGTGRPRPRRPRRRRTTR